MGEKVSRAERARQDRMRQKPQDPHRPKQKPKESTFDKMLERGRMSPKLSTSTKTPSKAATEQAIRQATKHQERNRDDRERKDKDRDEGRDSRQGGKKAEGKIAGQKVIAKGKLKQGGQGAGGGRQDGRGQASGRRGLTRVLTKAGAKSLPVNLQGKFNARLAQAMKGKDASGDAILSQQILNKIVQFVRIGLNRKGEKEIQIELNERIFRGLKLRVIARGGKVGVYLRTSDPRGKKALQKNKEGILKALADKGIEVDEIEIS